MWKKFLLTQVYYMEVDVDLKFEHRHQYLFIWKIVMHIRLRHEKHFPIIYRAHVREVVDEEILYIKCGSGDINLGLCILGISCIRHRNKQHLQIYVFDIVSAGIPFIR